MWFLIIWFAVVFSSLLLFLWGEPAPDEEFARRVQRDHELRDAHDWYVEHFGRAPTAAELWEVVPPIE